MVAKFIIFTQEVVDVKRRAVLVNATVGASGLLAGCVGAFSTTSGGSPDEFEIAIEAAEADDPLEFTAEVTSDFTADRPAELAVTLRNEAEFPLSVDGFAESPVPFNLEQFEAVDGENTLIALHDREPRREGGCWVGEGINREVAAFALLDAGENLQASFGVFGGWNSPEPDGTCLASGEYRATQQVSVDRQEENVPEFPRESTLSLRLSLSS